MANSQQIVTFLDIFYFNYTINLASDCEKYLTYLNNLAHVTDNEIFRLERASICKAAYDLW